jgi:hypothetical protein
MIHTQSSCCVVLNAKVVIHYVTLDPWDLDGVILNFPKPSSFSNDKEKRFSMYFGIFAVVACGAHLLVLLLARVTAKGKSSTNAPPPRGRPR